MKKEGREGTEDGAKDRMLVIMELKLIFIARPPGERLRLMTEVQSSLNNSLKSEDSIFIEKSFTGWLKAIVISN